MIRSAKYFSIGFICVLFSLSCINRGQRESNLVSNLNITQIQKTDPIKGIFSFGKGENFPNTASLKLDYIAGMSSIFSWESMEPQEGHYDFTELESEIAWATKNKKKLNICLYAGNKSPSWLSSKNIPMIHWRSDLREDQAKKANATYNIETAPAFWDTSYLSYWRNFIDAFASKYKNNETIGYITITGPTPKDLSTGTVIKHDDDWQKIIEAGYTYEKHVSAWKNIVDHFFRAFPNKPLVIALGPLRPGGSSSLKLSEAVVDYVIDKKYSNVHFLCVILNDTWFKTSFVSTQLRNLFKRTRTNGQTFGYQLIYSAQRMDGFKTQKNKVLIDYNETLNIAIEDGASWIEIWHDDIIDPKYRSEGNPNSKYEVQIKSASTKLSKLNGNTK